MKQEGFTHIGQTATTRMGANPNADGNNAGRGGAVASPEDTAKAVAFLVRHRPEEVDEAAALRASQLGADLRVEYDYRFPRDANGNPLPMVKLVKSAVADGDYSARQASVDVLRKLQSPAEARDIEGWLAELSVIVAKRQGDEFEENLRLEAYASRLRRYSADVAKSAVLSQSWKFWPAWAELERVCDQLSAPRQAMIMALERGRRTEPQPGPRVTAERAAEIMREVFGDMPGND